MKWLKINDKNFTAKLINVQYTIDTNNVTYQGKPVQVYGRRTCDITIELIVNNSEYNYITNLYDNFIKFELLSSDLKAEGCFIRTITIDTNKLKLEIVSDYIKPKDLSERRDEIIDEILNETSNKNII